MALGGLCDFLAVITGFWALFTAGISDWGRAVFLSFFCRSYSFRVTMPLVDMLVFCLV
jgi:hypothetical protein